MRRVPAWFRSHPLTTIFLAIVGFAVGMHFFADWRAEVRWQRYCAEARARGVKLTLAEFAPPEIPDAENFAALPMFRAIFAGGMQRPMELPIVGGKRPLFPAPERREHMDWLAWQTFFKGAGWISETTNSAPGDVLRGLEHYAPQFKEWSEWRTRTRCRFTLDTADIAATPFPHLGTFLDAAKLFALRMSAHLDLKDSAAAYVDFQEGVQAYLLLSEEPAMLTGLVRISAMNIILNAVGDGLSQHAWADAELKAVAEDLASIRVPAAYVQAFSSERGYGNKGDADLLAMSPLQRAQRFAAVNNLNTIMGPSSFPAWAIAFVPRRVYRDNQLRFNLHVDELTARVTANQAQFLSSVGTASSLENPEGLDADYFYFFSRLSGVFSEVIIRFVQLQTQLDETRVAVALERWRLARGSYPETLAELVPEFLPAVPVDTWAEKPLVYRRTEAGTFLLYGVGRNRTDDGGMIDPKLGERRQLDDIWLYAPRPGLP